MKRDMSKTFSNKGMIIGDSDTYRNHVAIKKQL